VNAFNDINSKLPLPPAARTATEKNRTDRLALMTGGRRIHQRDKKKLKKAEKL